MQKRGQVSVFAIVGVVIVILVALFFFFRNEYGVFVAPTSFLGEKAQPIEDNLKDCVNEAVRNSLESFGKQGGDLGPINYRLYQDRLVKYYCTNIPGEERCLNVMPTLGEMTDHFNEKIQDDVNNCVDKDLVRSGLGYEVKAGELTTETSAEGNRLIIRTSYDVDITKDVQKQSVRDVVTSYDAPIEDLYSVAVDIVNAEANVGFFEQLLYMVNKRGQYVINVDKPYPDKIYRVQKKDSGFEFWFAVEGERRI